MPSHSQGRVEMQLVDIAGVLEISTRDTPQYLNAKDAKRICEAMRRASRKITQLQEELENLRVKA